MTNKMIDGEKLLEWIPQNCSKECITDDFYHKLKEKIQSLMSEPATDTNVATKPSEWQVGDSVLNKYCQNGVVNIDHYGVVTIKNEYEQKCFSIKNFEPDDYKKAGWRNIDAERRALQAEIAELKIEKETNND